MSNNTPREKDGFVLYKSRFPAFRRLNCEQKGRLFDAIFNYQIDGKEETDDDIQPYLDCLISDFLRDAERYAMKVEQARAAANERWSGKRTDADKRGKERTRKDKKKNSIVSSSDRLEIPAANDEDFETTIF